MAKQKSVIQTVDDEIVFIHQPIVIELAGLLDEHKDWELMLLNSLKEAKEKGKKLKKNKLHQFPDTIEAYFDYLDKLVQWTPTEADADGHDQEVFIVLANFYWLIDQPSGRELQKDKDFVKWMVDFANDWGSYLNTAESINPDTIKSFIDDPYFKMEQYLMPPQQYTPRNKHSKKKSNGPSGWMSFNQMFAREVNPGLRPVAGMFDDNIIVSPADCTFKKKFRIDSDSEVTIKITHNYKIDQLLEGSPYAEKFRNGLFMHSFLGPNDYHRFHAPVRGTVLESRAIQEKVYLNVVIKDGKFDAPDGAGDGYEFSQTRGLLVLDSPIGLVAVLPIGMAQVSSVNMTAVEGAYLNKGDEFGYFLFGGSDIIMLFQEKSNVTINAAPTIHYNSGMCIGEVIKR